LKNEGFYLEILIYIALIIFISAAVRGAFGFGDALIAMPLLALVIDIKIASPIVALMGLASCVILIVANKQKIALKPILPLIIFSAIGIPLGVWFLKESSETLVKIVLGATLLIFSAYSLLKPNLFRLKTEWLSLPFGLVSGMLGGAYNSNGPPIIIYGSMRRWQPVEFRLKLQWIFLPTNICIITGHLAAGLWTSQVLELACVSVPAIILGLFIGSRLGKIIPQHRFNVFVYVFLAVIGLVLLGKQLIF
jgi:uncharacterized protein